MIVVDTNVWSELTRAEPAPAVLRWERERGRDLWLCSVVLGELRASVALAPAGRRADALRAQIEAVATLWSDRLLAYDEPASRRYGVIVAARERAGRPIGAADAMIAATALAHGMAVATRDVDGFDGTGVRVVDPWQG